jgi:F0F1-type ATP synthase membrane subunit b/b'
MQENQPPASVRNELLERLKSLSTPTSPGPLAELAYQRAKEALEQALEEARAVRLQAIEDARRTRERELSALSESLESFRLSAQSQVESLLRTAEIEAGRLREQAEREAEGIVDQARKDALLIKAEGEALLATAQERGREVERLETDFNKLMGEITGRLGIQEQPSTGWLNRLGRRDR